MLDPDRLVAAARLPVPFTEHLMNAVDIGLLSVAEARDLLNEEIDNQLKGTSEL